MPLNFKQKGGGNENLQIKTRSATKKLSLSMKSKQKNISNQNLARQLPTIGQLFVTKLSKKLDSSRQNKTVKKQPPLKLLKEENFNRMNSVKSKILQNSRERKLAMESRPKLLSVAQTKTNEESKDSQEKLDTSILQDSANLFRKQQNPSFIEFYENLENLKKITITVDYGVQTDNVELNKESYEEYIKLRITQREKFDKLRNLFKYIQNLETLESQNFRKHLQEYHHALHSKDHTMREERVTDLMEQLNHKFLNFHDIFKEVFLSERQNFKDFHQIHADLMMNNKQLITELGQKIKAMSNQSGVQDPQNPYQQAFDEILQKQEALNKDNNKIFNDKMTVFYKNYKDLEEKYNEWNQHTLEQSRMIKNCVTNILELPELSIGLFGTDKSNEHSLTNSEIKASCTDQQIVPIIVDFFMRRDHPQSREINEVFLKCCEVKCMNCIYLRTKMRYIYHKNSELKPVVKVLMNLVQSEPAQAKFEKIATNKNLAVQSKRTLDQH